MGCYHRLAGLSLWRGRVLSGSVPVGAERAAGSFDQGVLSGVVISRVTGVSPCRRHLVVDCRCGNWRCPMSTRMLDWAAGSATSTVPAAMVKVPRTGAIPKRCRVLNATMDRLGSMR